MKVAVIVDATAASAMLASAMPRKLHILLVAFVVVIGLAIGSLIVITAGRSPANPPLPNPNGYDNFLQAAALVTDEVGDASALDHDDLRAYVSTHAETVRRMRLGLTRQCAVEKDSAITNLAGMAADAMKLESLARLLAAEGRLAEMESRYVDAAHAYLNAIEFGNAISRGGSGFHRLRGISCELLGFHALVKVVPKLSHGDTRVVLTALEKVDADRITWAEIRQNSDRFDQYQSAAFFRPIWSVLDRFIRRNSNARNPTWHNLITAHERLLAAELALRCYQSAQERVPARLADLVTNYLSTVPQDPFNNQPMIYRPQGTNWLLYSVGPDGMDDGGKTAGWGWPVKGDIRFDSLW